MKLTTRYRLILWSDIAKAAAWTFLLLAVAAFTFEPTPTLGIVFMVLNVLLYPAGVALNGLAHSFRRRR